MVRRRRGLIGGGAAVAEAEGAGGGALSLRERVGVRGPGERGPHFFADLSSSPAGAPPP